MKQWWIYLLAGLFLFTGIPVGAAENPSTSISVVDVTVAPGTDIVDVYFHYDTTEYLLDGGFFVTFPADKVMPEFGGPISFTNPAEKYCQLPQCMMNIDHLGEGYFRMSFIGGFSSSVTGQGQVAKISFCILDPSVEGSYPIHFYADRLVKWVEGNALGQNLVSDETPIEDIGYITVGVDSQITTSAPTTITTTTQTTTLAPTTRETTTTTSAVTTTTEPTTGSETTITGQLPTSRQPEEEANTVPEPTERDAFPRWILFVAAAGIGIAILIPITTKLRKK